MVLGRLGSLIGREKNCWKYFSFIIHFSTMLLRLESGGARFFPLIGQLSGLCCLSLILFHPAGVPECPFCPLFLTYCQFTLKIESYKSTDKED